MSLPKISVWSLFRADGWDYVHQYANRINSLDYPPHLLKIHAVEGDSTDNTLQALQTWAAADERVTVSHFDTGIARQYHTTRPERMKTLALSANVAVDAIAADDWPDYAMLIESDLLYPPELIRSLLEHKPKDAGLIAPMVWIKHGDSYRFYDIWGFRTLAFADVPTVAGDPPKGMFPPNSPEWYWANMPQQPYEVFSAGSCAVIKIEALKQGARVTETEAIVGMCRTIRELGYKICVDPNTHIIHPPLTEEQNRYQWRHI